MFNLTGINACFILKNLNNTSMFTIKSFFDKVIDLFFFTATSIGYFIIGFTFGTIVYALTSFLLVAFKSLLNIII